MADGAHSGEAIDGGAVEAIGDVAHRLVNLQLRPVRRGDPDALLAAVLQRIQPEVGEIGGLRVSEDSEDAAFFLELVHSGKVGLVLLSQIATVSCLRGRCHAVVHPGRQARRPARLRLRDVTVNRDGVADRDANAVTARPPDVPRRHAGRTQPPRAQTPAAPVPH